MNSIKYNILNEQELKEYVKYKKNCYNKEDERENDY